MPDTPENQQAYPQPPQQQPGLGFPLARIAAFFSLSCGAVLDLAICSNAGKGHSELGMLHKLWDLLRPGDILLADSYMCAWHEIFLLKQRGIDTVTRIHHCRKADFRRGKRVGKGDHIVEWPKPEFIRSIGWQRSKALPEQLTIRETRVQVQQPGFRSRTMIVVSTLVDAEEVNTSDLAELYRAAGMLNSTCDHSSKRCRWTSCVARHQNLCGRRSGRTFLLTILSAPSSRRPQPSTTSSQERSASRAQFKHCKPFNL